MTKKVILIAAAGLLTTATLIAATTVHNGKAVKTAVTKDKKTDFNRERTHCFD